MAKKVSPVVRLLVSVLGLALCIGIGYAVFVNSGRQHAPAKLDATKADATKTDAAKPAATKPDATKTAQGTDATKPAGPTEPKPEANKPETKTDAAAPTLSVPAGLHAQIFKDEPLAVIFAPLGSADTGGTSKALLEFSPIGAGLKKLTLADHFTTVDKKEKVALQTETSGPEGALTPFAALAVTITDSATNKAERVRLTTPGTGSFWRQVAADKPGHFEAFILDEKDTRVLRIERIYSVKPGSYDVAVTQRIENLSGAKLTARFEQYGPADLPNEGIGYGGDKRRLRFGHLLSAATDPGRQIVQSSDYLIPHQTALGARDRDTGTFRPSSPEWPVPAATAKLVQRPLWPDAKAEERKFELVWAGIINRYYGIAVHPLVDPADPKAKLGLNAFSTIGRYVLDKGVGEEVMALWMFSPSLTLEPKSTTDLSFGVYAGPLAKQIINTDPVAKRVGLDEMIVYSFGGLCGPCTFEFLTHWLLALLTFLRNNIFFDWSLSIIFLVVIVRTILHPVTKWTQVRMQRFGKQMGGMAPKQKKIQERYGNDRQKMQQEMAKLWREEGVSPLGFLGCLPMFLVMPIWIALSAMLSFAQELQQQPAFYGVFQKVTGHSWHFLADLAEPDHFISFGTSFKIPLLSTLMGPISSFNIVPLVLGVVFFAHQKYLTPPQTAPLTPEQETQMKITKWMSVIMFPVMMYNAPSGLALYFTANSTFAIFENQWIRRHIDKHDLLNPEKFKKKPKASGSAPTGFMARLQAAAEAKMKENEAKNKKR